MSLFLRLEFFGKFTELRQSSRNSTNSDKILENIGEKLPMLAKIQQTLAKSGNFSDVGVEKSSLATNVEFGAVLCAQMAVHACGSGVVCIGMVYGHQKCVGWHF